MKATAHNIGTPKPAGVPVRRPRFVQPPAPRFVRFDRPPTMVNGVPITSRPSGLGDADAFNPYRYHGGGLGVAPAAIVGAYNFLSSINPFSSKGPDKQKWKDRTEKLKTLSAAAMKGDMSAITRLEVLAKGRGEDGTGDRWGDVYKPIIKAYGEAAAAARLALGKPATPPIPVIPKPPPIPVTPDGPTPIVPPPQPADPGAPMGPIYIPAPIPGGGVINVPIQPPLTNSGQVIPAAAPREAGFGVAGVALAAIALGLAANSGGRGRRTRR